MSGFLLDTNVVSEMTKETPDPRVVAFLAERRDLWLSVIVVHELAFGLRLLPQGQRRELLEAVLSAFLTRYESRILPLGRSDAEWAAELRAQARLSGRTLDQGDALIAGTAKARGLSVATRNTKHFDYLEVQVTDPWTWEASTG